MCLLVRKIIRAKWMQNDIINGEDISADAVTICLKTSGNALSTWQVSREDEITEAILALASSGQHLDTIHVVCLDRSLLESQNIALQQSPGKTPIKNLVDRHIDISNLTYTSLGIVAKCIAEEIKKDKVLEYTKGKLQKLLNDAIEQGRFKKDDLDEHLREKL